MKTLGVFLCVVIFVLVESHKSSDIRYAKEDFVVFHAMKGVLQNYHSLKEPNVHLIYGGNKSQDLAEKILLELPVGVTMHVTNIDAVEKVSNNKTAIILFDSGEVYSKYMNRFEDDSQVQVPVYPNRVVFVPKRGKIDLLANIQAHSRYTDNTNFIKIVNESTVDLIASFNFEAGKCWQPQYKVINRFSINSMKWDNDTFFPEKFENLNGCFLYINNDPLPSSRISTTNQIFKVLAKTLNFQPYYVNSVTSSIAAVKKFGLYNIINAQHKKLYEIYDFSSALYTDYTTCTVPSGEPYTQLEKMFLMFDKATWICIGATLAGALLVIQVINCLSIKVQKFVFGRDVRTPTLNVASIFLTGGQHRVPRRNFARFLLILFIMWSLIIRTCYQSMLYKNLQKDLRRPRIKTFDELNEKNFKIGFGNGTIQALDEEFREK
jgi:hypothetical protein